MIITVGNMSAKSRVTLSAVSVRSLLASSKRCSS